MSGKRLRPILIALSAIGIAGSAFAQDAPRRVVVEDVPSLKNIYRVSASKTHSGYPVPRFVSLKYGKVNGRQGPSTQHPILWQYRRKGLPLVVVAEMDIWRKVRDHNGDESWVRTQALSGVRTVMVKEDIKLFHKADAYSKVNAIASKDALLKLVECPDNGWCRVRSDDGLKGWVERRYLWGAEAL